MDEETQELPKTSLLPRFSIRVLLALLTAGEAPDSPHIKAALARLRRAQVGQMHETYTVALIAMAFAAADPEGNKDLIGRCAELLEDGQILESVFARAAVPNAGGAEYAGETGVTIACASAVVVTQPSRQGPVESEKIG